MASLRCAHCGGPAFDCDCWRSHALDAEARRAERIADDASHQGDEVRARVFDRQARAARRLMRETKRAGLFAAVLAVGVWADPALAQSCGEVTLVLPRAFALSASEGAALGAAILGVWGAAYFFRSLVKSLNVADSPREE